LVAAAASKVPIDRFPGPVVDVDVAVAVDVGGSGKRSELEMAGGDKWVSTADRLVLRLS
jgi:hypothetical protein